MIFIFIETCKERERETDRQAGRKIDRDRGTEAQTENKRVRE